MNKNKVKFQPVTLVLNKKELKLLHCLTGNITEEQEFRLLKGNTSLYESIDFLMLTQNVKPLPKEVSIEILE